MSIGDAIIFPHPIIFYNGVPDEVNCYIEFQEPPTSGNINLFNSFNGDSHVSVSPNEIIFDNSNTLLRFYFKITYSGSNVPGADENNVDLLLPAFNLSSVGSLSYSQYENIFPNVSVMRNKLNPDVFIQPKNIVLYDGVPITINCFLIFSEPPVTANIDLSSFLTSNNISVSPANITIEYEDNNLKSYFPFKLIYDGTVLTSNSTDVFYQGSLDLSNVSFITRSGFGTVDTVVKIKSVNDPTYVTGYVEASIDPGPPYRIVGNLHLSSRFSNVNETVRNLFYISMDPDHFETEDVTFEEVSASDGKIYEFSYEFSARTKSSIYFLLPKGSNDPSYTSGNPGVEIKTHIISEVFEYDNHMRIDNYEENNGIVFSKNTFHSNVDVNQITQYTIIFPIPPKQSQNIYPNELLASNNPYFQASIYEGTTPVNFLTTDGIKTEYVFNLKVERRTGSSDTYFRIYNSHLNLNEIVSVNDKYYYGHTLEILYVKDVNINVGVEIKLYQNPSNTIALTNASRSVEMVLTILGEISHLEEFFSIGERLQIVGGGTISNFSTESEIDDDNNSYYRFIYTAPLSSSGTANITLPINSILSVISGSEVPPQNEYGTNKAEITNNATITYNTTSSENDDDSKLPFSLKLYILPVRNGNATTLLIADNVNFALFEENVLRLIEIIITNFYDKNYKIATPNKYIFYDPTGSQLEIPSEDLLKRFLLKEESLTTETTASENAELLEDQKAIELFTFISNQTFSIFRKALIFMSTFVATGENICGPIDKKLGNLILCVDNCLFKINLVL